MIYPEIWPSPGAAAGDLGDLGDLVLSSHGRGGPLQGPRQARGGASTARAAWEGAAGRTKIRDI